MKPGNKTPLWAYALGAAALAVALWGVRFYPEEGLNIGSPAPAFHLIDSAGRPAILSAYRGKVVLLDFWATWCSSCLEELPAMETLYRKFQGPGFEILGASVDEDAAALSSFLARHALPYRVLHADSPTARSYRVWALPSKYLIDSEGMIYRKYLGEVDPEALEADIRTLLDKEAPTSRSSHRRDS